VDLLVEVEEALVEEELSGDNVVSNGQLSPSKRKKYIYLLFRNQDGILILLKVTLTHIEPHRI